jgi:pentatricopeptide repeat protein
LYWVSVGSSLPVDNNLSSNRLVIVQAILSSMIGVFLESKDLDTAMRLFREAQESDIHLSDHTVNAMLNAIAKTGDLEKVVKTVTTLAKKGFEADKYTYTAILNACQRADAGELAFTIWRQAFPPIFVAHMLADSVPSGVSRP